MGKVIALRMIDTPAPFRREEAFFGDQSVGEAHSLHYALNFPHSFSPDFAGYFISRYTRRGEVVLDPFCGAGMTPLEAALQGRVAFASDRDPLSVSVTASKLAPADLTEVTLKLQLINLRRPVTLENFNQIFAPFYDVETYRELLNLKNFVAGNTDRTTRFIGLMALSLLHGNNAGYFSAYSLPHLSITPEDQQTLNFKRGQSPDYRPLIPRLLRRAAFVFRDGIPSVLHQLASYNHLCESDARDLSYVGTGSVDLVVTAPPLPGESDSVSQQWLRYWFAGLSNRARGLGLFQNGSIGEWRDFMNEVLVELARVVRPGGRAVFDLREIQTDDGPVYLDEQLAQVVQEHLSRFWDVEGVILEKQRIAKIRDCSRERDQSRLSRRSRAAILRRK